jgi:hypothetical protein
LIKLTLILILLTNTLQAQVFCFKFEPLNPSNMPTELEYEVEAKKYNVEVAALKAIAEVESLGSGFLPDGRPKILFEGHKFWQQLQSKKINPNNYLPANKDILYPNWTKEFYAKKGDLYGEYDRLNRAIFIDRDSAYMSCSYGTYQILGSNFKLCGYDDIEEFVIALGQNEINQLRALLQYLDARNMIGLLNMHNWAVFAYMYNGPRYKENDYDLKLSQAYLRNIHIGR